MREREKIAAYRKALRLALRASDDAARVSYAADLHQFAADLWAKVRDLAPTDMEREESNAVVQLELKYVAAIRQHLSNSDGKEATD